MRYVVGRLALWIAEILDRSLLTVPDLDLDGTSTPSRSTHRRSSQ
jgi:hypothetical protein